jgi:phage protein U
MPNTGLGSLGGIGNQTVASPEYLNTVPTDKSWYAPTFADRGGIRSTLYSWGPIQFEIFPLNVHEVDHETGSDWAHKEIAGAPIYREWVGENDELIHLRGRIFPYRIGGMSDLDHLDAVRRAGVVNALLRGNPAVMLGWFVCERLVRSHTWLSSQGVGQQVTFEAIMARAPVPASDSYFAQIWGTSGAA